MYHLTNMDSCSSLFSNKLVDNLNSISKMSKRSRKISLAICWKNYWCIYEPKGHYCVLKMTISSVEGCLPLVSEVNSHKVICTL